MVDDGKVGGAHEAYSRAMAPYRLSNHMFTTMLSNHMFTAEWALIASAEANGFEFDD
ncbi:hypothetical protein ACQEVC_18835 [Plantactinospora sp. CA-294935]|uniref:hypothetical protein n=1 Tax=Plantactinospora sp. CA-294935 TaxID=3240012 RepID=UPI003D939093